MSKVREYKFRRISRKRDSFSKEKFIDYFIDKGYDKKHILVLHENLIEYIGIKGYSVYPNDDLREMYGFEDLDDIDFIDQLTQKLNLRNVTQSDCDSINENSSKFDAEYILKLLDQVKI